MKAMWRTTKIILMTHNNSLPGNPDDDGDHDDNYDHNEDYENENKADDADNEERKNKPTAYHLHSGKSKR